MDPNVQEALSTEEKPIIENIISLFQQLLSMQSAGSEPVEVVEEELGEPVKPEKDPEAVEKSSEGETGDDPAEKRIEEVTPTTDASLQDLKKSIGDLVTVMGGKKAVQKSQPIAQDNKTVEALGEIAKVLKGVVSSQNTQEQFNSIVMNAIGYSDDVIKKSIETPEKKIENKPIGSTDANAVIKALAAELLNQSNGDGVSKNNPEYQHAFNQKKNVRKNLKGIAEFVHNGSNATTQR